MKSFIEFMALVFLGTAGMAVAQDNLASDVTPHDSGVSNLSNDLLEKDFRTAMSLAAAPTVSVTPSVSTRRQKTKTTPTDIPYPTIPDVPMSHNFMTPVITTTILPTAVPFILISPTVVSRNGKNWGGVYPTDTPSPIPYPTEPDVPMSHNFMTPLTTATVPPQVTVFIIATDGKKKATPYPTDTPFPTIPVVPMSHNYMTPLTTPMKSR